MFVQPAQHKYFEGSSTEMAKLSLPRSRPAVAQLGHCVTQLRPTRRKLSRFRQSRIWK